MKLTRQAAVTALTLAIGMLACAAPASAQTAGTPSPAATSTAAPSRSDLVIIDATQFLADMPNGDIAAEPRRANGGMRGRGRGRGAGRRGGRGGRGGLRGTRAGSPRNTAAPVRPSAPPPPVDPNAWTFENFTLALRETTPVHATVNVPAAGDYTLFVRSDGATDSSFHVAINKTVSPVTFGNRPHAFQSAGQFTLPAGAVTITLQDIRPGASTDVLVLSKSPNLREDDLKPFQYPPDVVLLKDYHTAPLEGVKFGDLNGDGKTDLVAFTSNYSSYAYDNDGHELWHFDEPAAGTVQRSQFECPGVVWDFDHDGKAEVAQYRIIDNQEWLVVADGATGAIKYKTLWPTDPMPHAYNNFRLAIGKLHPGYPDDLLVYTDSGHTVSLNAYGPDLKLLWSYSHVRLKDYHGHYIYPVDINGDGIDEVYLSQVMLDAHGKVLWDNYKLFPDNHDHIDSARFMDINGDGKLELITGQSDVGTVVYDATTGKLLWQRFSNHTQKIEVGDFLAPPAPQPQVVAGSRYYVGGLGGLVRYFDARGNRLAIWPANPIPGNPNFVKGDWTGTGHADLFWLYFHLDADGRGTKFFPDPVFQCFDFMRTGNDQVVTTSRDEVRIYGYRNARTHAPNLDPDYLYKNVANHTHY